jgi:mannose-6-phosphate isomerase-like protein (cupin superfamily)/dTDP-glucose pyrophosphorylase
MQLVEAKQVKKIWGQEIWLSLNDRYCYKRIYINKGYRTSFQYHNFKRETNYIIEGEAEIWIENDDGAIEKRVMRAGEFFDVIPPKKHRVVALTDVVLQEVSTPEVDDVVRVQDDHGRPDGRIEAEHLKPAFCILAAGKGARSGPFAETFHKGLMKLGESSVIANIIDKIPQDLDIVVAVGHNGVLIKEYCRAAYPDRQFTFVDVDKYDGEGSGPGYSILQCKEHLQRPFYFSVVDCLIEEPLPYLDGNWLGVYPTDIPEIYSTVEFKETGEITGFKNKSKDGYKHSFIGLASIYDYNVFWKELENNIKSGEIVSAFDNYSAYPVFKVKLLTWSDVGTVDGYLKVAKQKPSLSLEKTIPEVTYKTNGKFIKINANDKVVSGRISRSELLHGFVPRLTFSGDYTIAYNWIEGQTLYQYDSYETFQKFFNWYFSAIERGKTKSFIGEHNTEEFYNDKTRDRLKQFFAGKQEKDWENLVINGKFISGTVWETLDKLDWTKIKQGRMSPLFHGDLQFDNVIYDGNNFTLIDWRDSFGNGTAYGDLRYDLAKLLGGMHISYLKSKNFDFNYTRVDNTIEYKLPYTAALRRGFNDFYTRLGTVYNLSPKDIWAIVGLIYLNMSPLHPSPMSEVLFCEGLSILDDATKQD